MEKDILKKDKLLIFIKLLIWLMPLLLIIIIVNKNFVFTGNFSVRYNINNKSNLFENFAAKENYELIGKINEFDNDSSYFQYITTTPLYFDVKVPRLFPKATVKIKYQNPDNQPIINLGIKQKNDAFLLKRMSLVKNNTLNNLEDYWSLIQEGDIYLWQKDTQYYIEKNKLVSELDDWYGTLFTELIKNYPNNLKNSYDQTKFNLKLSILDNEYTEKYNEISSLKYKTIENFIGNFPSKNEVVNYNYNLSKHVKYPDYVPSNDYIEINKSIRGSHEIYTYIGENEVLDFNFTVQDINRHVGNDELNIKLFDSDNNLLEEFLLPDDGEITANGNISLSRQLQVKKDNLAFGTYRLELNMIDDDLFIKKIITKQHLFMFKGNIYLTDNIEYNGIIDPNNITATTIYTNSDFINARTSHENGIQTLKIGKSSLAIDKIHEFYELNIDSNEIIPIISPKNDIYIEGNKYFTFSEDQFFDPNFETVKDINEVNDINSYNYIIAEIPETTSEGDWQTSELTLEVPDLYITEGETKKARFILDFPGLPENNRKILINEVEVNFQKEPISINTIFDKIKALINKN